MYILLVQSTGHLANTDTSMGRTSTYNTLTHKLTNASL